MVNPAGIALFDGRWTLQTGTAHVGLKMVHGGHRRERIRGRGDVGMDFEPDMNNASDSNSASSSQSQENLRVLIYADEPDSQNVAALLSACEFDCMVVENVGEMHSHLLTRSFDVVVVPSRCGLKNGGDIVRKLQPNASMVLVTASASLEDATHAMRAGASDLLVGPLSSEEIEHRVRVAAERSREHTSREQRADRIRGICRRIEDARRQVLAAIEEHGGMGPSEMGSESAPESFDEPSDEELDEIEMCSEFRTLLRQELDVEDLLRTALEYILLKTGPTNAAVFLAGGEGNFGLGAYVNYDLTRAAVEPMLKRLGDEACSAIAEHEGILRFDDAAAFVKECDLGSDVPVDQQMLAVPCHHDGDCLAVMVLFRSESDAFEEGLAGTLDALREIMGDQLATLIRVHNRLDQEWPDEPADDEPGFGDLAA